MSLPILRGLDVLRDGQGVFGVLHWMIEDICWIDGVIFFGVVVSKLDPTRLAQPFERPKR